MKGALTMNQNLNQATHHAIVKSGENKGKTLPIRPMTLNEVRALRYGERIQLYSGYAGGIINVKVNGAPKTWKRRPADVTVPVKYGLYDYTRVSYEDGMPTEPLYFVHNTSERS